jgi:hypothetical protein
MTLDANKQAVQVFGVSRSLNANVLIGLIMIAAGRNAERVDRTNGFMYQESLHGLPPRRKGRWLA